MRSGAMSLRWLTGAEFEIRQGRSWLRVKVGGPLYSGKVISRAEVFSTEAAAGGGALGLLAPAVALGATAELLRQQLFGGPQRQDYPPPDR
jgi:hypothetical protein